MRVCSGLTLRMPFRAQTSRLRGKACESKWGQIKIQEDRLIEARNAKRNFALTPFA